MPLAAVSLHSSVPGLVEDGIAVAVGGDVDGHQSLLPDKALEVLPVAPPCQGYKGMAIITTTTNVNVVFVCSQCMKQHDDARKGGREDERWMSHRCVFYPKTLYILVNQHNILVKQSPFQA